MNLNKMLQYVAQTIAIYLIFKYVPSHTINNRDIIIITIIITLFCVLMENIIEPSKYQKEQLCSSVCSNKKTENMTSLNTTLDNIPLNIQQDNHNIQQDNHNIPKPPTSEVEPKTFNLSILHEKINQIKQSNLLLNDKLTELSNLASVDDSYLSSLFPATYYKLNAADNIEKIGSAAEKQLVRSDMPYNDFNHLPIPTDYVSTATDYGYSFLPPEKWYPEPPFPPVCVTDKRCPVVPLYTTGTNVNLKDWDNARRITPPDNINTEYVKEVLNSGK